MIWPFGLLRRSATAPSRRSLEAAGDARRWRDAPQAGDGRFAIQAGAAAVAVRATDYVLNSATGSRIKEALVAHLIGTGITPRPLHPAETMRDTLATGFTAWTEASSYYSTQAELVADMVVLGEGLAIWTADPATGAPLLRRLHPEQLDRAKTATTPDAGLIANGVEFDRSGAIVAYWIRQGRTLADTTLAGLPAASVRQPASEVIHLFRRLVPGQVRGLSWFAPVLATAAEFHKVMSAIVARVRVAALHAGFIMDADGAAIYDGDQKGSTLDVGLEPGAMITLPPGKSVEFANLPDQGDIAALERAFLRLIAAGCGVTFEMASGDYSQANYSSTRAAMLEFRRFAEAVQHLTLIPTLCAPAWRRVVTWQVLDGRLSASAFQADRAAFLAAKWLPPAWPWIDPRSDAEAAILEMENNLRSRSEVVAERGYDIEALDREIAADQARAARLGITPATAQQAAIHG